jgi:bifunctional DNA-binding transcriptional regulator/antitoxin component of YhaV-PrlF toxin-antitoxin module
METKVAGIEFDLTQRPRPETKTGRVWALADEITAKKGRRASRTEVMEAFAREGGNMNTASTQYSHWRADFDRRSRAKGESFLTEAQTEKMTLTIGQDGRVLIPHDFRRRMMIGPDGRVSATLKDGELRLKAPGASLGRLQQMVKELDRGRGSVVDELIADRRAESQ